DLTRLTDLEPLKADHYLKRAEAQFLAGDRPSASSSLTSAVRIDPNKARLALSTLRRLGQSLQDDNPNDLERVADWYTAALRDLLLHFATEKFQSLRETYKQAALLNDVRTRTEFLATSIDEVTGVKAK